MQKTYLIKAYNVTYWASQAVPVVKNPPANFQDTREFGFNLWVKKILGVCSGTLLHYYCLENSIDREA